MSKGDIVSPIQKGDLDPKDAGNENLVADLEMLLALALAKKFHDFESGFGAPKMLLKGELSKLIARTEQGWYDN